MQFIGRALVASAVVLGACAGGEQGGNAGTGETSDTTQAAAQAPAQQGGGEGAGGAAGGAGAPITGKTHEVRMVLNQKGEYRFEPADITVKQGDGIKWVMVSGGPHNVAFDPAKIPDDVEKTLSANMPNQMMPLGSPMYMNPGESYTISFAGIKAGKYPYHCTPHLAMGMTGNVTVQ